MRFPLIPSNDDLPAVKTALVAGVVTLVLGCGETLAPGPASVQVTSAMDTILALSRTAQLTATAMDAAGTVLGALSFTWATSNSAVLTVSTGGLAQPQGSGVATVTATTIGASPANGIIRLTVVPANLTAMNSLPAILSPRPSWRRFR